MKHLNSPKYDKIRNWIREERLDHEMSWEQLKYGSGDDLEGLQNFLVIQNMFNRWPNITVDEWASILRSEQELEDDHLNMSFTRKSSIISSDYEVSKVVIPKLNESCWQQYKLHLLEDEHFSIRDVDAIERSAFSVLQRLNSDTKMKAVKGAVIGNVQSGKTANMAALMAMAADWGWNMFIVLSGTIENLRIQTQERLLRDLQARHSTLNWQGLTQLSLDCEQGMKAQSLYFNENNHTRYLTVTLKNSKRLENLLKWLHEDKKSTDQMKVLIIDDESDQAGINTKKIDKDERTKINQLLVNLVNNKDHKGNETKGIFKAMNYIGYTATPYANLLNEAKEESLYPHDFISTLQVSKSYFGPQQIFGDRVSGEYNGLNIVRTISKEDVSDIKLVHKGESAYMPETLEASLCWFLCCAATYRKWNYRKPVSMLIHTSQKQDDHSRVQILVESWLKADRKEIFEKCRNVWEKEIRNFTKDSFYRDYPDYSAPKEDIIDYPQFEEIEGHLDELVCKITNIKLGEDNKFKYSRNVHICVDNCRNNGIADDNTYLRLAYPKKADDLDYATAFIVIGGATLSRGLTLEGLVSTFFLRTTKQADTLMQMGRWFGYRRGYELLPRIWLTEKAQTQFEYLSDLDSELRDNIANMELLDKKPRDYAVVLKQSPSASLIGITNKNRMQAAVQAEMDYSGLKQQTHQFVPDEDILIKHYNLAIGFISKLGRPSDSTKYGAQAKGSYIWENVSFDCIYNLLLEPYTFPEKLMTLRNVENIKAWVDKMTEKGLLNNWNVILYGLKGDKRDNTDFSCGPFKMVGRTKNAEREDVIDVKILSDPKEKIIDIKPDNLPNSKRVEDYLRYSGTGWEKLREDAGLGKTPNLILYVVDKDSKPAKGTENGRVAIGTDHHLVGISINVPGTRANNSYTHSVQIDLNRFGFGCDVEDLDNEN